ncbi:MAG: threonine synthase [Minwuia sp.]|uniref:threonine synthase n=1 Tax=Minwuia sp. TaxID=2493630 RepID=UPI003A8382F8
MIYQSTRGEAPDLAFEDVLLAGLARDGGLYVPKKIPEIDLSALAGTDYPALAAAVLAEFTGDSVSRAELEAMARAAYDGFDHAAVAPIRQIGPNDWLMELFHGPTLAFKDFALQVLGRLFDQALSRRGERVTILGATSGDTGSAAIEGCRGRDAVDIFILFPKGRVSDVQRRQMTTVDDPNVHAIAVDGDFDDCQALVKAAFGDLAFRDRLRLSAVNSINWARVAAQVVYYVHGVLALGGSADRKVAFSVPSGNFGNVFAGHIARQMGADIGRLVVGANVNDILHRFVETGSYRKDGVVPTMSPSMDIQVASNFERLLFELTGRDGAKVRGLIQSLGQSGGFDIAGKAFDGVRQGFASARVDEEATLAEIRRLHAETGEIVDPHTAVGTASARQARAAGAVTPETPLISLATAHPAKFPDAVERAIGRRPALPERMGDLMERPERAADLPNDLAALQTFITERARVAR